MLYAKPYLHAKTAKHLAPGKVRPGQSFVGYMSEAVEAIALVFKDTPICDDAASAQVVSFARNVGARSVALDGEVYELSVSGVLCVYGRSG